MSWQLWRGTSQGRCAGSFSAACCIAPHTAWKTCGASFRLNGPMRRWMTWHCGHRAMPQQFVVGEIKGLTGWIGIHRSDSSFSRWWWCVRDGSVQGCPARQAMPLLREVRGGRSRGREQCTPVAPHLDLARLERRSHPRPRRSRQRSQIKNGRACRRSPPAETMPRQIPGSSHRYDFAHTVSSQRVSSKDGCGFDARLGHGSPWVARTCQRAAMVR